MIKKFGLVQFVTPVVAIGAVLTFAACGSATGGKTLITQAKPTETEAKLNKCANDKLSVESKTFAGTTRTVCRVDGNGKYEAHELRPLFAAAKLNGRIKLRQEIVVNVDFVNAAGDLVKTSASKRAERETAVIKLLAEGCRPLVKNILGRSGFASSFGFRVPKPGDVYAQPSTTGAPGSTSVAADDDQIQSVERKVTPAKTKTTGSAGTETQIETTRTVVVKTQTPEFHNLLALALLEDGQVKLMDEVDPALSGSIVVDKTGTLSDQQKLFCAQIASRMIENFGLSDGRDCDSRGKKVGDCAMPGKTAGECTHTQSTASDFALIDSASGLTAAAAAVVVADAAVSETAKPIETSGEKSDEKTAEKPDEKSDQKVVAAAPSEGAAKTGAEKDSSKGIFKAVQSGTDMKTATLSSKEIADVVLPVCGTLEASPIVKK